MGSQTHTPDDEDREDPERDVAPRRPLLGQHHYRNSTDPDAHSKLRLLVERSSESRGLIRIAESVMTSHAATAVEIKALDELHLEPAEARWLRDALVSMNLDDVETDGACPA